MPFTVEQFLQVFAEYNLDVWPAQMVLVAAGIVTALLSASRLEPRRGWPCPFSQRSGSGAASLTIGCTCAHRSAAWAFGALFVAGAVPLFLSGKSIEIDGDRPLRIALGGAFVLYALFVYPAAAYLTGHVYPEVPTFGAPCPLVFFSSAF